VRGRQLPVEVCQPTPTMVDQMVTERALPMESTRLGFQVTDRLRTPSANRRRASSRTQVVGGRLCRHARQQISPLGIRERSERQILISRCATWPLKAHRHSRRDRAGVPEEETRRSRSYVKIPNDKYKRKCSRRREEVQNFYRRTLAVPDAPRRRMVILIATRRRWSSPTPADADLRRLYNQTRGVPHAGARQGAAYSAEDRR